MDIGQGEAQCTLYGLPYLECIFFNEILGEVVSSVAVVAPPELANCSKGILRLLLLICNYVSLHRLSVEFTGLYQYHRRHIVQEALCLSHKDRYGLSNFKSS